jgi:hypothetical protein
MGYLREVVILQAIGSKISSDMYKNRFNGANLLQLAQIVR